MYGLEKAAFEYAFIGFFLTIGGFCAWSILTTVWNLLRWLHEINTRGR